MADLESKIRLLQIINCEYLVLSGGAAKGIALCGALCTLHSYYLNFCKTCEWISTNEIKTDYSKNGFFHKLKGVGGTSIGSLLGLCVVMDMSPFEMKSFFLNCDLFKGNGIHVNVANLFHHTGLSNTEPLIKTVYHLFDKLKLPYTITFEELYQKTQKLFVCNATCVENNQSFYMSHLFTPNMEVRQALTMSMCLPLVFNPVDYQNKKYVDGGMSDNCMIDSFKEWYPQSSILALYCKVNYIYQSSKNVIKNVLNFYQMMGENHFNMWYLWIQNKYPDSKNWAIPIQCPDSISLTSFIVENSQIQELFNSGRTSITQFITLE